LNRLRYRVLAGIFTFIGGVLGGWFGYLDVTNTSYVLTVGPAQNQIYINTGVPLDTIAVFLFGALFSLGLSMILNLHPSKE
jgi:hypothetical protein